MAGPTVQARAPSNRPKLNVFSLFDHWMGRYVRGKDDLWYLNGGMSHTMAYGGKGNSFKSTLSGCVTAIAAIRYQVEFTEFNDTELSLMVERIDDYLNVAYTSMHIPYEQRAPLADLYFSDTARWNHIAADVLDGDVWWRNLINDIPLRQKLKGKALRETPFIEIDGNYRCIPNPWLFNIDSFSEFKVSGVIAMYQKNDIGDRDNNTVFLKDSAAKAQLMEYLPQAASMLGGYFSLVAHLDHSVEINTGPTPPADTRKLEGLKNGLKIKGVPGRGFTTQTNNFLMATGSKPLLDDQKLPKFPHPNAVDRPGDPDLKEVTYEQLRGKSGGSGDILRFVFSQREGLKVGLTEFNFLNDTWKNWGLTYSSNGQYRLDVYPDIVFTRKTLRDLTDNDPVFSRALAITVGCCWIQQNYFTMNPALRMDMATLRERITAAGYSWDKILNETVEYWYFQDQYETIKKRTVTAYTLLHLAAFDTYRPKVLDYLKETANGS